MLKIKSIIPAVVFMAAFIVTGCSETTPVNYESSYSQNEASATLENITEHTEYIRIKPGNSYMFSSENTPIERFFSIKIFDSYVSANFAGAVSRCSDLFVYGHKSDTESELLSCNSYGKDLKSVIIQNTSNQMVDLKVVLKGRKISKLTKN